MQATMVRAYMTATQQNLPDEILDLIPALPAQGEIRREERFSTSWLIVVAMPDGSTLPSSAKDVSMSGARLAIPAGIEIPETIVFNVVGKPFVVQAKVAWRRGDYVGVTIVKTANLPAKSASRTPSAPVQDKASPLRRSANHIVRLR